MRNGIAIFASDATSATSIRLHSSRQSAVALRNRFNAAALFRSRTAKEASEELRPTLDKTSTREVRIRNHLVTARVIGDVLPVGQRERQRSTLRGDLEHLAMQKSRVGVAFFQFNSSLASFSCTFSFETAV